MLAHRILKSLVLVLALLSLHVQAQNLPAEPKATEAVPTAQDPVTAPTAAQTWLEVELGVIGSSSLDILKSAFIEAQQNKYAGIVVILDTPGGALDATRSMVKHMLASPLPLVVWVGPSGAHAGSAGSFITLAAHLAAMAPGTHIGAAHPIASNGENIEDSESDLRTKVENDTVAFMESIASVRGRNKEMAASFVANSLSVTAQEALDNKVIDLIASDVRSLLQTIDGRQVKISEKESITLHTLNAKTVVFQKTIRQELLEILSNPNLFYLLFLVGLLGLAFEFTHPGVIAPGVIGAICLILALIASSTLPVNFGSLLLIVASIGFIVAEMFVPSFGVLGIGGLVGFVTGSVLLFDAKNQMGLGISIWTILPTTLVVAGFGLAASWLILRNQKSRVRSGIEAVPGMQVEAVEFFVNGHGQVRMQGEYWNGVEVDQQEVKPGDRLLVQKIDDLKLQLKLLHIQRRD